MSWTEKGDKTYEPTQSSSTFSLKASELVNGPGDSPKKQQQLKYMIPAIPLVIPFEQVYLSAPWTVKEVFCRRD